MSDHEHHEHVHHQPDMAQIIEILDIEMADGWLNLVCHMIDDGKTHRHITLFFDVETCVGMHSGLGALIRMYLASEDVANGRAARQVARQEK